ncbi:MAG: hypothetical protein DHS20C11_07370 [Lysobacteraceae bacterium]|nr:MAG: hypothetical protein DHS20C11_07370 [Xanthomonadaceae bacterium]
MNDLTQMPDSEAKNWAVVCHLSALSGCIIPFGNLIAPLVIWLLQKDRHPLIDANGKEAVNFQISVTIYLMVAVALMLIVIGFFLAPLIGLVALIFIIVAAVKTSNGETFRYPLSIRLIQ